mgnify:CR=1 FL=1
MNKPGSYLSFFVVENNIRIMAEIGVWKGRCMRTILRSPAKDILKEYWAIDPYVSMGLGHGRMSELTADDWNDIYIRICQYAIFFPQLQVLRASSPKAACVFPDLYFDFVYIDALHTYEGCRTDIKAWLPKVKKEGIIGGHDYLSHRVPHKGVTTAVDEIFKDKQIGRGDDHVWYVRV